MTKATLPPISSAGYNGPVKPGDLFSHRYWLDSSTNKPLRCKITKVARGVAYYRPHYGLHDDGSEWLGGASCVELQHFAGYFEALQA